MNVSASTSDRVHPRFEPTGTVEVPVFYPTLEEMKDFPGYINKIEQEHHAHLICGIAKVSKKIGLCLYLDNTGRKKFFAPLRQKLSFVQNCATHPKSCLLFPKNLSSTIK